MERPRRKRAARARIPLAFFPHLPDISRVCTLAPFRVAPHRVSSAARETTGRAKNTFRINCRAGIPGRCAEQNAATLRARRTRGATVTRLVPTAGTEEEKLQAKEVEYLVKMQTSLFSGPSRARSAARSATRCCRVDAVQKSSTCVSTWKKTPDCSRIAFDRAERGV